ATAAVHHSWHPLVRALLGAGVSSGALGLIWFVYPRGMGFGDMRLEVLLGLLLGWASRGTVLAGFLLAFLLGGVLSIALLAVGLPRLVLLASRGEQRAAARAASAFVGVAAVSAALAPNHTVAFFGLYNWGTGFLFVVALASAWALGASLDAPARRELEVAVLAAVLVNAVLGLVETVVDLDDFHLGKVFGRAMGLLGNPIHLGTACAAGLALLAVRRLGRPATRALAIVLLAGALEASGTRAALL